jgi:hypothetical protein
MINKKNEWSRFFPEQIGIVLPHDDERPEGAAGWYRFLHMPLLPVSSS